MRNKSFLFWLPLIAGLAFGACTKNSKEILPIAPSSTADINEYVKATVASGQVYSFTVGSPGSLTINRQPIHAQVSQIVTEENGAIVYNYSSVKGFAGTDELTLSYDPSVVIGNTGSCPLHSAADAVTTPIVIKIEVTN